MVEMTQRISDALQCHAQGLSAVGGRQADPHGVDGRVFGSKDVSGNHINTGCSALLHERYIAVCCRQPDMRRRYLSLIHPRAQHFFGQPPALRDFTYLPVSTAPRSAITEPPTPNR